MDIRDSLRHRTNRRRSESLEPPEHRSLRHEHRRNLSMETHELSQNLAAAVGELNLVSLGKTTRAGAAAVPNLDPTHDYAEIYTPSKEVQSSWMKESNISEASNNCTSETASESTIPRAPTPPLHRFPSWEAKIYQVANDGLTTAENSEYQEKDSTGTGNNTGTPSRSQQTGSRGYCDINVPVYATVKGVSSI